MTHATGRRSPADLIAMKRHGTPIVVATAYDVTSGRLADLAGMDAVIVGDSIALTVMGGETILAATIDELVLFARAAARGARRTLVVGDLPFGSYEVSDEEAVRAATRLVKEGGVQAVKLEGGGTSVGRARAIADAGIAVMAHLVPAGPLWVSDRWRWSAAELAQRTFADALELEAAGCFAVMLECVPAPVAAAITTTLSVPTIGFGCGPGCDGQVLSLHDVLGLSDDPPAAYSKRYAELARDALVACERYVTEVRNHEFPAADESTPMSDEDRRRFAEATARRSNGGDD